MICKKHSQWITHTQTHTYIHIYKSISGCISITGSITGCLNKGEKGEGGCLHSFTNIRYEQKFLQKASVVIVHTDTVSCFSSSM